MLPKSHFFAYVANTVKLFLTKHQTENPMIQFSFFDLGEMVRKLLEIIIKPEFLKKYKNRNKMKKMIFPQMITFSLIEKTISALLSLKN